MDSRTTRPNWNDASRIRSMSPSPRRQGRNGVCSSRHASRRGLTVEEDAIAAAALELFACSYAGADHLPLERMREHVYHHGVRRPRPKRG